VFLSCEAVRQTDRRIDDRQTHKQTDRMAADGRMWHAGQTEQREVQIANVRIGGSGSGSPATRISAAEGGRRLWDEELPGTTLIAAGSLCFVALAFADKSLQVLRLGLCVCHDSIGGSCKRVALPP
jgi:hypothetical protein